MVCSARDPTYNLGMPSVPEGYADHADAFIHQYESVSFADVHQPVLHLIPTVPGSVLDIGAGTGRDAAALGAMGHHVMAVEPVAAFRDRAASLHPSTGIEWVDDSLPDLARIPGTRRFDLIMLTAVWMHLDPEQRRRGMKRVSSLVRGGGTVLLSLRYGPVPTGRRMFHVSPDETIRLASVEGLTVVATWKDQRDFFGRSDVTWTSLAFMKAD